MKIDNKMRNKYFEKERKIMIKYIKKKKERKNNKKG